MTIEGYDLVMLGILAAAAVLGYFKGIVWQLAWIAGIVVSGGVAFRFAPAVAPAVAPFLGQQEQWNRVVAMLLLYAGTSLVIWLLFRVVSRAVNAVHLSAFDHQLGLLLGLAKGALLCIVVTFFAVMLAPAYSNQIKASHSGTIVTNIIIQADTLLPPEFAESIHPFVTQFEERLRTGNAATTPGQPSPWEALWEGVTSAAAWTSPSEQGGSDTVLAGGHPPATNGQDARNAGGVAPSDRLVQPAGYASPSTPTPGGFVRPQPPATVQPPPGGFPIGSRSPLPRR